MKWTVPVALAACAASVIFAAPAQAEKLTMDHRLQPRLEAVMAANRDGSVYYEDARPKYVLDRIVIQGDSAQDWREALEIWVLPRGRNFRDAADWYAGYRQQESAACTGEWSAVAQDDRSATFTRQYRDCPPGSGPMSGIYRMVLGKKTVYLLKALYRGEMDETSRQQWLALMASAHINP
ncbi:MAG: hypothetical protein ABI673_01770 [Novosphingobium sp.]